MPSGVVFTTSLTGNEYLLIDTSTSQVNGPLNVMTTTNAIADTWGVGTVVFQGYTTTTTLTTATVTLSSTYGLTGIIPTVSSTTTVQLPASPVNGQVMRFSNASNTSSVTISATVTTAAGGATYTVNTNTPTLTYGQAASWIYQAANSTWYRY